MNRSFSLIWNERLGAYVPAPESARRRGKGCGVRALGAAVLSAMSVAAHALPSGGQVSAGQGSIAQSGSAMTVTQQSQNLAINWRAFGIGASESVNFAQPNASSIALNRVLGADPSQIYGRLSANGQVWILNPNGVLFGGGAQVNVGGLVASTLNISDADFLAGKRSFSGNGGTVTNMGSISAADGGYVALLGGKVSNEGVIQARLGTVALGAGDQITLDFAGDKLLNLQVDQGALNALVQNKQLIQADGGTVLLSARAANALLDTVVNNAGIIEARTIDSHGGTIKLLGAMEGGTVQVGGTLDASAPNGGDGGFIETSGAHVSTAADARITTAALTGATGQWLIDPTNFTIARDLGDITGAALASQLNSTNVTILSSSGGAEGSGDVKVNDNVVWNSANSLKLSAYHDVKVVKVISNSGTGGVTLRADNAGNCVSGSKNCGTISFTPQARITVNGGAVNLYYNPVGSNMAADANGNGPSYANPTDYSGHVTLNGGSTLNAWMLVNDVNQLQAMNTNLGGSYALGRNIDASATAGWNGGAGFVPISSSPNNFLGYFDGLDHTITGLTINRPSSNYVGLFARNNGQIRNVGMVAGAVSGNTVVGGLVGFNGGTVGSSYSTGAVNGYQYLGGLVGYSTGTVGNSYNTGAVKNGFEYVGGLVGYNTGTVSNSYSTGAVGGHYRAGGLVGVNDLGGTVSNSYSTGAVSGYAPVGGLVGVNDGTVSNSYSTGAVGGWVSVGGLVGSNGSGTVSNSYSTGAAVGVAAVGGLVGSNGGTVSNSYWDITTSGQSTSAGGTGLTTAQMMQQASFTGFDFGNTWWMSEGNTRPFLRMEYSTTINNAHQLQLVALNPNASYTLGNDIDMSELSKPSGLWNVSAGFVPLTLQTSGKFDGGGHVISGLTINRPLTDVVGLFSQNTGSIANVGLSGGSVNGGTYVGGLVGNNFGTVSNSYSTGIVHGFGFVGGLVGFNGSGTVSNSYSTGDVGGFGGVGGLVGSNDSGTVSNSYSTGDVGGYSGVGGLVGSNDSGTVSNSYSTGDVGGHSSTGGLIGANRGTVNNSYSTGDVGSFFSAGGLVGANGGTVNNSYSTGAVYGFLDAGGLVGDNEGTVSNSYSTGAVNGDHYVGGLVGFNHSGTISNSYWDITTSGQSTSAGGTGLTDVQMKQKASFTGFDFVNIWGIDEGVSYPFLLAP